MNKRNFFWILFISAIIASTLCARRFSNKINTVTRHVKPAAQFPFIKSKYKRVVQEEKPIIIVIPSYNNKLWYKFNIDSILQQNYTNYHVIYIADGCATQNYDGTGELVAEYIHNHPLKDKFTIIKNGSRKGALYNLYHAITSCEDDAIIVTIDGDDWLYHDQALSILNDIYSTQEVWLTHGTFIEYPRGRVWWSEAIPDDYIKRNAFREYKCASHLRTFYAWLFKLIKLDDLMENGEFYQMTWDQAIMFPMCEMAGERHRFIDNKDIDALYVYNIANQINDYKVNAQLQRDLEKRIRAKQPYTRLESRP